MKYGTFQIEMILISLGSIDTKGYRRLKGAQPEDIREAPAGKHF